MNNKYAICITIPNTDVSCEYKYNFLRCYMSSINISFDLYVHLTLESKYFIDKNITALSETPHIYYIIHDKDDPTIYSETICNTTQILSILEDYDIVGCCPCEYIPTKNIFSIIQNNKNYCLYSIYWSKFIDNKNYLCFYNLMNINPTFFFINSSHCNNIHVRSDLVNSLYYKIYHELDIKGEYYQELQLPYYLFIDHILNNNILYIYNKEHENLPIYLKKDFNWYNMNNCTEDLLHIKNEDSIIHGYIQKKYLVDNFTILFKEIYLEIKKLILGYIDKIDLNTWDFGKIYKQINLKENI